MLALLLEQELSKKQILELYLNRIYLSGGVYGVETMSQNLYGKPASKLTLPEAALIAGLIRAPSALSPWSNLDGALDRSRVVLQRMREEGFITAAQEKAAAQVRPRIRPYPGADRGAAGYAKEFLRQQFRDRFGGDHPPDWQVRTTFVPDLQEAAERAVENGLRRFGNDELQAALVAIDPATGDVLALVGGRDFRESQFNRAWRSRRQPGSAFKPFLYAAALANGYSPVSVLDGLTSIAPQGPEEWAPRNAQRRSAGSADAARRADRVEQPRRGAAAAADRIAPGAAAGVGRRPARSARRAVAVARHRARDAARSDRGVRRCSPTAAAPSAPRAITRVIDADGGVAYDNPARQDRVVAGAGRLPDGVDARGRRRSRHGVAGADRPTACGSPSAGKTGTTDDFKDAWFVGFTTLDRRRRVGRRGSARDDRQGRLRRALRAADLERVHQDRGAQARRARVPAAPTACSDDAALQGVVPEAGRRLPDLQRVLQGRRRRSRRACAPFTRAS